MVVKDKDKELETPQPQEAQQMPQPTNSIEYMAMANRGNIANRMALVDSLGARVAQRNAEIEAYNQQRTEALNKANEARENKRSIMKALLAKQKPEYDEDRAKRIRNNAIIQSFGDMMNAATRGYFAYRPQGAGVYPKISENSPLKNIEELNRMREEYLKRNEAWKNLGYEIEAGEADAKVKAAESLATIMDEAYRDAIKRGESAEEAFQKAYDEVLKASYEGDKEIARAIQKAEGEDRRDARTAAQIASRTSNSRSGSGSGKPDKEDEVYAVVNAVEALYGDDDNILSDMNDVTTSVKPHALIHGRIDTTTSTKKATWGNLTEAQRKNLYHKYKNDPRTKLYTMGIENGTLGNAVDVIKGLSDAVAENLLIVAERYPTEPIGELISIYKEGE